MPIAAVILFIEQLIEKAVEVGTAVAPLVPMIIDTFDKFGTENGATPEDFARVKALVAPYEADLQVQADAAQAELDKDK